MPWKVLLLALSVAPLTGCLLAQHTARNLLNEPAELHDNKKIARQLRRDAEAMWAEVRGQYPQRAFTADYADGFTDGYVDYLDSGGTAQPPAVPPLKYRRSHYMNVEGHALIRDYFCGFKYGCEVAAASGKRDLITVPILLPEPPVDAPVQARLAPRTEVLPKPKHLDSGTGLPLLDRPLAAKPMSAPPLIAVPKVEPAERKEPVEPAGHRSESETVAPLRDIPATAVKPYRAPTESKPVPPWRGE